MGLKVTDITDRVWTVTGAQEYKIPMSLTQEMEGRRRPDADYFEPKVSINFPCCDDKETLDNVKNVHLAWNAFYKRSKGELREEIEKAKKELQEDEILRILERLVQKMKREDNTVSTTNVVALGIGSLHSAYRRLTDDEEEERKHHQHQLNVAHNQLAMVIKLTELLGEEGKPLPCVIQDPAYSAVEKECLRALGFRCVDDPDAFSSIDNGSLLFSVGTYWHMLKRVSMGPWPAALVCNGRMCNNATNNHVSERNPDSIKNMIKGCDEEHFPIRRHANSWTNGVVLYRRKVEENRQGDTLPIVGKHPEIGCVGETQLRESH